MRDDKLENQWRLVSSELFHDNHIVKLVFEAEVFDLRVVELEQWAGTSFSSVILCEGPLWSAQLEFMSGLI